MRAAPLTLWLAMLLTICPRSHADTGEPSSDESGPAAAETQAQDEERRAHARELFQQGELLYRSGDYEGALRLWLQCYELATLPLERARALWIIAQAYRQSGQCELARDKYREYAQLPAGEEARAEAQSWVEQLDTECPVEPPASVPQPQPVSKPSAPKLTTVTPERTTSPAEQPTSVRPWLAWSALGAGAATAIASVGYALASQSANEEYRQLERRVLQLQAPAVQQHPGDATLGDQMASVQTEGRRFNTLAWVLGSSAVVLSGVGATLLLLPKSERPSSSAWSITSGPNASVIGLGCSTDF